MTDIEETVCYSSQEEGATQGWTEVGQEVEEERGTVCRGLCYGFRRKELVRQDDRV